MFCRTRWLVLAAFAIRVTAAYAHDALQSSTNIWLRHDEMEVELILSRVPARSLVDNAPSVPVTVDNFESTYHALFQKSAPSLVEVSVDGQKIAPRSITVELYQETDLRFDYLFPRPPNGKLSFTASFIRRMDEGYINSLGVNEGLHMIGMDDQNADRPTWDMSLGADLDTPAATTQPTSAASPPVVEDYVVIDQASRRNFFFKVALLCAIILLLSLGVILWRKGGNSPPPSR